MDVDMEEVVWGLKELGIDPSELEIDFESKLSPEEFEVVHDAILEKTLPNVPDGEIHAGAIEYYDPNRRFGNEDYLTVDDAEDLIIGLENAGLEVTQDDVEEVVAPGSIDHSSAPDIYRTVSKEFVNYAANEISDKRSGKVHFAREALENPFIDFEEALRWFEEKDELNFEEFNQNLFDDNTSLRLGKDAKVYGQTVQQYWDDIKDRKISDHEKVTVAALLDVTKALEGLAQNKDDPEKFNQKVQNYQDFFNKFRMEEYEERLLISDYPVHTIWSRHKMNTLADQVGSCLVRYGPDEVEEPFEENERKEAFTMYSNDPFTFIQAVGWEKDLVGYTRSFLMEDSDDQIFLGVDTIEPTGVNGIEMEDIHEDLEEQQDVICAGALGAIKLGEQLGVDYVAGKDARIKFGPRQGYRNTSRDITYEKLGDPVPYYSVVKTDEVIETEHKPDVESLRNAEDVELEQLDNGDWRCEYITTKPGFAVYHEPGEQEVRGFQAEEGQHTTEAKILMEFPHN